MFAPDVTLRMDPQPAAFIPGTSSRMNQKGAVRSIRSPCSHSSSSMRVKAVRGAMAALLTRTSTVPRASAALRQISRTEVSSPWSPAMPTAPGMVAATRSQSC